MAFYPWGQVWWQAQQGMGWGFASMPYWDVNTNTSFTQFREYSMNLGRWYSPDPLGGEVANPQSLNRYAYVDNNPTTFTDPLGLYRWVAWNGCTYDTAYFWVDGQYQGSDTELVGCPGPSFFQPIMPSLPNFGGGGGGRGRPTPPQTQAPQKKPCTPLANKLQGTPAAGVDTLFDAFNRLTHPLDMTEINGLMFVTGGVVAATGLGAIGVTCFVPEPFEPLACSAGVMGGAPTAAGGAFLVKQSVSFFKNYTLPAIKDWGCHE